MKDTKEQAFLQQSLTFGEIEVHTQKPPFPVLKVKQTHSAHIVQAKNLKLASQPVEGDGIVQFYKETPLNDLAIVTADCVPIFLEGELGVAAIHAGWRGLAKGILKTRQIKAIKPQQAYLAPHIRTDQYEVSSDFRQNFPHSQNILQKGKSHFFDLTAEVCDQLQREFPQISILDSQICTYKEERLHSFRREQGSGRNWNVWRGRT